MKRYIDVSGLPNFEVTCSDGKKYVLLPFEHLSDISSADVVEAVRCKDCQYYDKKYHICLTHSEEPDQYSKGCYVHMNEDDFCSYGERKAK